MHNPLKQMSGSIEDLHAAFGMYPEVDVHVSIRYLTTGLCCKHPKPMTATLAQLPASDPPQGALLCAELQKLSAELAASAVRHVSADALHYAVRLARGSSYQRWDTLCTLSVGGLGMAHRAGFAAIGGVASLVNVLEYSASPFNAVWAGEAIGQARESAELKKHFMLHVLPLLLPGHEHARLQTQDSINLLACHEPYGPTIFMP